MLKYNIRKSDEAVLLKFYAIFPLFYHTGTIGKFAAA